MDLINFDNEINAILQTLELAVQYGLPADGAFEQCLETAFSLCQTELEIKSKTNALQAARREETIDEFSESYKANIKNVTTSSVKQCARYKKFVTEMNTIQQRHGLALSNELNRSQTNTSGRNSIRDHQLVECGDDMHMNMQISDIDPITKRPLENPCRNKHCNHVYGMDSVVQTLQINPKLRCPIMGCANKHLVKLNDLVLDPELARILSVQRASASRSGDSGGN